MKTRVISKEIRLLPMSKKYEFPDMSYEEIQESYFLNHLIKEQQGYYYFRNTGITCPEGSLILFQIDGEVIASATLLRTEKFKVPKDGIYKGAIVFDTNSISAAIATIISLDASRITSGTINSDRIDEVYFSNLAFLSISPRL